MAKKIDLTIEQINNIIDIYYSGKSPREIGKIFNFSTSFIKDILKNNNAKLRSLSESKRKYKNINITFFDNIDTEEKAYFLGLLFADGCVKSKTNAIVLKLIEEDKHILSKFSELIFGFENLHFSDNKKYDCYKYLKNVKNSYTVQISDEHIKKTLINLGCVPRKSLILKWPEWLIDHDLRRHFIRGYFDGDGCITYNKNKKIKDFKCSVISTKDFCERLGIIISELNINYGILPLSIKQDNGITRVIQIGGNNQVLAFLTWIYKDSTIFLKRKYNKYIELKNLKTNGH